MTEVDRMSLRLFRANTAFEGTAMNGEISRLKLWRLFALARFTSAEAKQTCQKPG